MIIWCIQCSFIDPLGTFIHILDPIPKRIFKLVSGKNNSKSLEQEDSISMNLTAASHKLLIALHMIENVNCFIIINPSNHIIEAKAKKNFFFHIRSKEALWNLQKFTIQHITWKDLSVSEESTDGSIFLIFVSIHESAILMNENEIKRMGMFSSKIPTALQTSQIEAFYEISAALHMKMGVHRQCWVSK